MEYLTTFPIIILRYHSSNMIINIYVDSAYVVLPRSLSRAIAWFIFDSDPLKVPNPMTNVPFHMIYNTMKNVISSTAKSKNRGIYINGQRTCPMQTTAINIFHLQLVRGTPFYTDNSTMKGILTASLR